MVPLRPRAPVRRRSTWEIPGSDRTWSGTLYRKRSVHKEVEQYRFRILIVTVWYCVSQVYVHARKTAGPLRSVRNAGSCRRVFFAESNVTYSMYFWWSPIFFPILFLRCS